MIASKRVAASALASSAAWWGIGARNNRVMARLSALAFEVLPRLDASNGESSKSAALGSGCGWAPAARMALVCTGPVMMVTRSPRATRSCATLSSGLMWPVGDSAAMRISAIVRYLSYPWGCQLAAAERLAHGRHERHPQRVVGGVVG